VRITKTTLEKYPRPRHFHLFGAAAGISRRLTDFFGCQHKDMSRPFSRQGETYRACLNCGARRQFDPENWETRGNYYHMKLKRNTPPGHPGTISGLIGSEPIVNCNDKQSAFSRGKDSKAKVDKERSAQAATGIKAHFVLAFIRRYLASFPHPKKYLL
jgi:hypothetical protein